MENNVKVGEMVRRLTNELAPLYGSGEAKAMTRLIFHYLKGWSQTDLVINADRPVSEYLLEKIVSITSRLSAGEPLQYVIGEARFYGMNLKVNPDVLIPRPETEELVDLIVKENRESDLRVLDIGTGSGAIAMALARNLKFPEITAIDVSEAALEVARENARELNARIKFIRCDIFEWHPEPDSLDIIVSNPPYIAEREMSGMESNVLDYEPHEALFVPDDDPLVYYRRIAKIGRSALATGGRIYFEINPLYADMLVEMMMAECYSNVTVIQDISHRKRFLCARLNVRE